MVCFQGESYCSDVDPPKSGERQRLVGSHAASRVLERTNQVIFRWPIGRPINELIPSFPTTCISLALCDLFVLLARYSW